MSEDWTSPLVPTKLFMKSSHVPASDYSSIPPALSPQRLVRTRLINLLDSYRNRRLILLQAPAGFGKTTLLAEFAAKSQDPTCWIRLESAHNDVAVMAQTVWSTLAQRFRRLSGRLDMEILQDLPALGMANKISQLVSDQVEEKVFFIFDDVQAINRSEEATAFLDTLLTAMPANITFMIGGRTLPAVNLSSLVIDGEVGGIGSRDLALSRTELNQLITKLPDVEFSEIEMEELYQSTEGWITGVLLSLKASPGGGRLPALINGDQPADFLAQAVIDKQPEQIRTFLLESSPLPWMAAQDLDRILERTDSAGRLAQLLRQGLFISTIRSNPRVYEYHPLFRQALLTRLAEESPDRLQWIQHRAAQHFEGEGNYAIAFDLYQSLDSIDGALRVAERAAEILFKEGRRTLLTEWAHWLRNHEAEASDLFSFVATDMMDRSRFNEARQWIQAAEESIKFPGQSKSQLGRIHNLKGRHALLTGDYRRALTEANKAAVILEDGSVPSQLASSYRLMATSQLRLGLDLDQAAENCLRAVELFEEYDDLYRQGQALLDLAAIYSAAGKPQELHRTSQRAHECLLQFGAPLAIAISTNNLAVVAHARGDYDVALRLFSEAIKVVRTVGSPQTEAEILFGQADLFNDLGLHVQAGDLYGEGLRQAYNLDDKRLLCYGYLMTSQLHRRSNNIELAHEWLDRAAAHAKSQQDELSIKVQQAALKTAISPTESSRLLKTLLKAIDERRHRRDHVFIHLQLAFAYFKLDQEQQILDHLKLAIDQAHLYNFQQVVAGELHHFPDVSPIARDHFQGQPAIGEILQRIEYMNLISHRYGLKDQSRESPAGLDLQAMGGGSVEVNGQSLDELAPLPRQLLFFLADNQPVSRDQILEVFWPDVPTDKQASSLYTALHGLRQALGKDIVNIQGTLYSLRPSGEFTYDVAEFERTSQVARTVPPGDARRRFAFHEALERYHGPYLPEYENDWVIHRRRELRRERLQLLVEHAEASMIANRYSQAETSLRQAIELEPLREDLHYKYLQVLHQLGRRSELIHHYQRLVRQLADELGIEPSEKIRQFYTKALN